MGHLAKIDGRVTQNEIQVAEAVMTHMDLSPEKRKVAIRLFSEGKAADFPLDEVLAQFRQEVKRRRSLLQMFMEILIQAAYADGHVNPHEKQLLQHIASRLGFSQFEYIRLETAVRAAQEFFHQQRERASGGRAAGPSTPRLEDDYAILGVSPDASDTEVKRAYRRLMNQHHPDKLVSKGLPEEMIKIATEKTHEIRAAYDRIRDARGI
jgi:DnaJ like chaperone protein